MSEVEERFDRRRRAVGLVLGPAACALLLAFPPDGLPSPAARLSAVVAWVLVWWITEPVPIPVTALLGPALTVVLGVWGAREAFAPFGDPIIFLFLGSFLLAEAMSVHGVDRRVATSLLSSRLVGGSPGRAVTAFAVLAAGASMWLSNTATTAMLYPIALGVLAALSRKARAGSEGPSRYATGLLLVCAYGSSIGGVGTPVGTPPNLVALGQLKTLAGITVPFLSWMLLAVPISAAVLVFALLYVRVFVVREPAGARRPGAPFEVSREGTSPMSPGEKAATAAFALAAFLWVVPGLLSLAGGRFGAAGKAISEALPESVVALLAGTLLFLLPGGGGRRALTWEEAARIDWGTLLLFGGGLSLGGAMFKTGLAETFGRALTDATGARSTVALTFLFSVFAIWFTEVTSNTATATMLVPLAIASARAAGVSPLEPAIGCAIGCSMAFMLPVATPPNAIVYGSGLVPIGRMARTGFWMNVGSSILVPLGVLLLVPLVLR